MWRLITLPVILVALVVMFYSPIAGWVIYAIPVLWFWLMLGAHKARWNPKPVPELSERANQMLKKFGAYYMFPFGSNSASSAVSGLGLALFPMALINIFQGFWWGVGFVGVAYVINSRVSWQYNPTQFIRDAAKKGVADAMLDEAAHNEVIEYVVAKQRERQEQILKDRKINKE